MSAAAAAGVLVVAGSVRPGRRSTAIADWVAKLGEEVASVPFERVDLSTLGLALDDEPAIPATGRYVSEATLRWSGMVARASAVAIVTPQYNWGYPAALKNAIDHLYAEWRDKPVLLVTYGGRGGGKCAAQLREVLGAVHARVLDAALGLTIPRARIEADDGIDPEADLAAHRDDLRSALAELVKQAAGASG